MNSPKYLSRPILHQNRLSQQCPIVTFKLFYTATWEFLLVLKCPLKVTHMPSMWAVNFFQSILWSPNSQLCRSFLIAILDDLTSPIKCGKTVAQSWVKLDAGGSTHKLIFAWKIHSVKNVYLQFMTLISGSKKLMRHFSIW